MESELDAIFEHVLANVDAAIGHAVQAIERADPVMAAAFTARLTTRLADAASTIAALRRDADPRSSTI